MAREGPPTEPLEDETVISLSQIERPLSHAKLIVLGVGLVGSLFISTFGMFAVTVALPSIGEALSASSTEVSWIFSAYIVGWACLMLLTGRVSDVFGRRHVLLGGLVLFGLSTAAGGFLSSILGIYFLQGLAGCGTALVIPASLGIIAACFPLGKPRIYAYAAFSAGGPAGAGAGELISGLLLKTKYAWRTAFFSSGAMACVPLLISYYLVPTDVRDPGQSKKMDWLGAGMMTAALISFLVALTSSQTASQRWAAPYIPPMLVAAALILVAFLYWQRHLSRQPPSPSAIPVLLPLRLFSAGHGKLVYLYACAFFVWASTDALQVNVTFYFQNVQHLDPFQAALRFLPVPVVGILACVAVALLQTHVPARTMICCACALTCGTSLIFALCDPKWPYWYAQFIAMILIPIATDTFISVGTILVADLVAIEEASIAQALLATAMRVGSPTGTTVSTVMRETFQRRSESSSMTEAGIPQGQALTANLQDKAVLTGLRASVWTSLVCMVIAIILATFGLCDTGIAGQKQLDAAAATLKQCSATMAQEKDAEKEPAHSVKNDQDDKEIEENLPALNRGQSSS